MNVQQKAEAILRSWAQEFHDCGDYYDGIKIVFDGFLTDDDGNEDENQPCYAIFIHRDSLCANFPEHDTAHGFIAHRPAEEACFYVWLDLASEQAQEINEPETDLDIKKVYRTIIKIQRELESD